MQEISFSEFDLSGKVALVTGAARGMGHEFALTLARYGADLIVCDILPELERIKPKIENLGRRVLSQKVDLYRIPEIQTMVDESMRAFGRIDILVNNAGINIPQWATEVTEEAWDRVINLNLKGLFFCCQAVGKVMIQQRKGKIINVSSTMGSVGLERRAAYSSSKAGVNLLTKVLAIEWAPYQINVNAIAPTFVETPLTKPMFEEKGFRDSVLGNIPLGRIAQTRDITGAVIYLASEASNMVTGHVLLIDGGWTAH
ncbi:MAG TPA: glucose 1-dehydrogenase [Thermodesulfobacteriota bacterium]|nr:glucose 1-dehydrogenase [Thermodesulfobacteriota bacterium]